MADVTDLFKSQKINMVKVGSIAAQVNNLISNDENFEALFQSEPIECLMQFGLTRKIATYMLAEVKLAKELTLIEKTKTIQLKTKVDLCVEIATKVKLCESVNKKCIVDPRNTMTPVCITDTRLYKCILDIRKTTVLVKTKTTPCIPNAPSYLKACKTYPTNYTTLTIITQKCPVIDFERFPKINDTKAWAELALNKISI